VSQISLSDTKDLLSKLLAEKVPVRVFANSSCGIRADLTGFVDSLTHELGVMVSASGLPIDVSRGFVRFRPFDMPCAVTYGEQRELPPEVRESLDRIPQQSCLLFRFEADWVGLFFTI
jgi:hypothetical protein